MDILFSKKRKKIENVVGIGGSVVFLYPKIEVELVNVNSNKSPTFLIFNAQNFDFFFSFFHFSPPLFFSLFPNK